MADPAVTNESATEAPEVPAAVVVTPEPAVVTDSTPAPEVVAPVAVVVPAEVPVEAAPQADEPVAEVLPVLTDWLVGAHGNLKCTIAAASADEAIDKFLESAPGLTRREVTVY